MNHDAYEGQADLVPPGSRMAVVPNQGRAFFFASAVRFASRRYKSEAVSRWLALLGNGPAYAETSRSR
jgi:hypothetical protein